MVNGLQASCPPCFLNMTLIMESDEGVFSTTEVWLSGLGVGLGLGEAEGDFALGASVESGVLGIYSVGARLDGGATKYARKLEKQLYKKMRSDLID